MSVTIESRDRIIDILSLSYLGDLLREQLGDDGSQYVWPGQFEKAVANIGFRALAVVGNPPIFDKLICIGDGLNILPRQSTTGVANSNYRTVQFISPNFTEIPTRCFERVSELETIVIPSTVTSIAAYAFNSCTGLTSVTIPNSVTNIGVQAFWSNTSLTSIYIPDSVTYIGNQVFQNCSALTTVRLPKAATYSASNGIFQNASNLNTVGPEDSLTDYNIKLGTGITSIPNGMLSYSTFITNVVIPDSVTRIETNAFVNCTGLTSVTIPNSINSIAPGAFNGCQALTGSITLDNVTDYDAGNMQGAFYNCKNITSISMAKIGRIDNGNNTQYAIFNGCSGMTSCQLGSVGNPITRIVTNAFYGCTNASLVVTAYTNSQSVTTILSSIRNGATHATIVIKAAADMTYDNVSYQAGDTVLTSTP